MHKPLATFFALASTLVLVAACCDCATATHGKRSNVQHRIVNGKTVTVIDKPEVTSPKSHKACVEDFHFTVGTPQYNKCLNSLSQIEDKSEE